MARAPKAGPHRYQFELGKRNYSATATVEDWVKETEQRMIAVARASIQDVINDAQTAGVAARSVKDAIAGGIANGSGRRSKKRYGPITKPESKGGRMRVDTGFLRASGQGSFNGMPTGPVRGDKKDPNSYPDTTRVELDKVETLELGSTFYFGWTAEYARIREAYDGFLEGAVQRWQEFVTKNVREIGKRIGK